MKNKFINSCGAFLGKDMPLSIKDKTIQQLALEVCKAAHGFALYQVYFDNVITIGIKDHTLTFQCHRYIYSTLVKIF